MGVPPSPHLPAAVITSWGISGAIKTRWEKAGKDRNETGFFLKPEVSLQGGGDGSAGQPQPRSEREHLQFLYKVIEE